MTNYEQIKGLFQKFADKYKRQICIETELSSASEDKAETKYGFIVLPEANKLQIKKEIEIGRASCRERV